MRFATVKELLDSGERLGITQIVGPACSSRSVRSVFKYPEEADGQVPESLPTPVVLIFSPAAAKRGFCRGRDGRHSQAACCREVSCVAVPGQEIPSSLRKYSERTGTPVFASRYDEWLIESRLNGLLREIGQRRVVVHGSLVRIENRGVLLMGESGVGKTATALSSMHSGNRWVADDAVVLEARGNLLCGRGHERTRDWIAVRGRGILRSERLLGAERLLGETRVDVIIRLIGAPEREMDAGEDLFRRFVGISIPCRTLVADVAPARTADRLVNCIHGL